jgi:hypothetical protein
MSGTFDFTVDGMAVTGVTRVQGRFQGAARRLFTALNAAALDEAEQVAELARGRIAEMFKNPSQMQGAVQVGSASEIGGSSGITVVTVSASGLPYMAIHEYGGVVMTPDIFPQSAKALHFFRDRAAFFTASKSTSATNEVFTQHTRAHPTVIPERSYLRYALAQRSAAIQARFADAAADAISGGT